VSSRKAAVLRRTSKDAAKVAVAAKLTKEVAGPAARRAARRRAEAGRNQAEVLRERAEVLRERAAPRLAAARERALEELEAARERAVEELVPKVREEIAPRVKEVVAGAVERTEPAREEALARGLAALAALRGEAVVAPPRRRQGRRLLLVLLAGVAAGAAARLAWSRRAAAQAWRSGSWHESRPASAPEPTPTPNWPPAAGTPAHDAAGASPDEALADAAAQGTGPTVDGPTSEEEAATEIPGGTSRRGRTTS